MTKDGLRSLGFDELIYIAEKEKINISQDMDKESLVTAVFDALEDDRLEREGNDNLTIQVEAMKYAVSQDKELFSDFAEDVKLEERYSETSLILMLRDPYWVYCYWDVENQILDSLNANSNYTGLILRVTELGAADWGHDSALDFFDVPVQFSDLQRYINLPKEDSFYGIELYAQMGEKETFIVRSNIIENSRDFVADAGGKDNPVRDQLIQLAGFSTDIGNFPGKDYLDTPQRIIGGREGNQ